MKWQEFVTKGYIKSVGFYFALFSMLCVMCQAQALPVAKQSSAGQGKMSGQKSPNRHQEQHPTMGDDDGGPGNCQPNVITFSKNPVPPNGAVTVTVGLYPTPPTGCSVMLTWVPVDDFTCAEPNCTVFVTGGDVTADFHLTAANLTTKTRVTIQATCGGTIICSYITIGSGTPYPTACVGQLVLDYAIIDADNALGQINFIRKDIEAILRTIDQANTTLTSMATLIDRINLRHQQQTPSTPQTQTPP